MTHVHHDINIPIASGKVQPNRRSRILITYFPDTFLVVENLVYTFTDRLCKNYSGGFWEFHELSNGGFLMSPDFKGLWDVEVPFGNRFKGKMSADVLGITVCLYTYAYMAEVHPESNFGDHYWKLRNFAYQHTEAASILNAID